MLSQPSAWAPACDRPREKGKAEFPRRWRWGARLPGGHRWPWQSIPEKPVPWGHQLLCPLFILASEAVLLPSDPRTLSCPILCLSVALTV